MIIHCESGTQGLIVSSCWSQAVLKNSDSAGFCSGVILKDNLVLTSAQCAKKYSLFEVAVGELIKHTCYTAENQRGHMSVGLYFTIISIIN